ncbi:MAG: hypothetical protein GXO27_00985 [Chlorobi bacterium]|nr:hypothetical protein [Chlorobiota bacterium]
MKRKYETADYYKLFRKIARNLKSGKITYKDIKDFVHKELGITKYMNLPDDYEIEDAEIHMEIMEFFWGIRRKNRTLLKAFHELYFNIFKDFRCDPFSLKYYAHKVTKLYKTLCENKNNPDYYKALVYFLCSFSDSPAAFPITDEHLKVLDTKYLTDSYDCL